MVESSVKLDIGLNFSVAPSIKDTIRDVIQTGFDFCCISLIHPRFRNDHLNPQLKFTRPESVISIQDWNQYIFGIISTYNLDCGNKEIENINKADLNRDLSWGCYLGTRGLLFELPLIGPTTNLEEYISLKMDELPQLQMIIVVPITDSVIKKTNSYRVNNDSETTESVSMWNRWNSLRMKCHTHCRLSVGLVVSDKLPSKAELHRWRGDSLKVLIFERSAFKINKDGYPFLSSRHKHFVRSVIRRVSIILPGNVPLELICRFRDYFSQLWDSYNDKVSPSFVKGYEDYLQVPLQPLSDDLESFTYNTFEQDPIKYLKYQQAILTALLDKHGDCNDEHRTYVLMVAGAGRGPLVTSALLAANQAGISVKIYAIEKNANAIISLQVQKEEIWGDSVDVIYHDMRTWEAPEKADILISELLGSFGDNELSPECLHGIQHHLKDDGVSIPQSYTSYLCPIQAPKFYQNIKIQTVHNCPCPNKSFEQLYVVYQSSVYRISEPQDVFTYVHPEKSALPRGRSRHLSFTANLDSVLYGFSGYFKAILYGDISISILPGQETEGLFSWFPIFLPIHEPVFCEKGDIIEIGISRLRTATKVWYEWRLISPQVFPVYNVGGYSYSISLK